MKKRLIIPALLLGSMLIYGESGVTAISITEYVTTYLNNSPNREDAIESVITAADAYRDAQISQASVYNRGLLETEYLYKQAQVAVIENEEVIAAVQHVFTVAAAANSLSFAEKAEEIAAAAFERAEELSQKDYLSAQEKRTAHITSLQAKSVTRSAAVAISGAQKTLARQIGEEPGAITVRSIDLSLSMADIPDIDWIIETDALLKKLRNDLSLHRDRERFLTESQSISPAELESLAETIEQIELQITQRTWLLTDNLEQLRSNMDANSLAIQIAELNIAGQEQNLEQVKHQYEKGEIHASDLMQAELLYETALEQLTSLERSRYLLVLESYAIQNISLQKLLSES